MAVGDYYYTTTACSCTASTYSTAYSTWSEWANTTGGLATTWYVWTDNSPYLVPVETEAEKTVRLAREAEYRAQEQERQKREQEGEQRANLLLRECLTSEQLQQLEKDKWFEVVGTLGKRYRLYGDGKVAELDGLGRALATFCIHPDTSYPMGDQILAKKLLLEADEERFLRIANKTVLHAYGASHAHRLSPVAFPQGRHSPRHPER